MSSEGSSSRDSPTIMHKETKVKKLNLTKTFNLKDSPLNKKETKQSKTTNKTNNKKTSKKRKKSKEEEDDDFIPEEEEIEEQDNSDDSDFKPSKSSKRKTSKFFKEEQPKSTTKKKTKKEEKEPKKKKTKKKEKTPQEIEEHQNKMLSLTKRFLPKRLLIGCHVVYSSKGIEYAPIDAYQKNCVGCFALFLGNQKTYNQKEYTDKQIEKFKENCLKYNYDTNDLLPHASYLINLANPNKEKLEKSKKLFLSELKKCELLGMSKYNFHPGSTVGECTVEEGCKQIADCINWAHGETEYVNCVLECTAGAGNNIGDKFEHLKMIIENVNDKSRVGVTIDTCHMFAAGYDIRTEEGCKQVFEDFDKIVGFKYLKGMHLNDSKAELSSKKDRHEDIGKGKIGTEVFKFIVNNPNFRNIPMCLETPSGNYVEEINELYSYFNEEESQVEFTYLGECSKTRNIQFLDGTLTNVVYNKMKRNTEEKDSNNSCVQIETKKLKHCSSSPLINSTSTFSTSTFCERDRKKSIFCSQQIGYEQDDIIESTIELKDITDTNVLSESECKKQYENLQKIIQQLGGVNLDDDSFTKL
ncbi:hypothetical protein ABK040_010299 [Willaertia magna]